MKAIIGDFTTTIHLNKEEMLEYCKPGEGADTCIWCVVGADGFECLYHNKPRVLLERWEKGFTVAKRDGCEKVKSLSFFGKGQEMEF